MVQVTSHGMETALLLPPHFPNGNISAEEKSIELRMVLKGRKGLYSNGCPSVRGRTMSIIR